MKIGFFFGAGAETTYCLPTGGDFTKATMLTKRSNLYDALKIFYANRYPDTYVDSYKKQFLFMKNSYTFRTIIYEAARKLYEKKDPTVRLSDKEKDIVNEAAQYSRENFKIDLANAYDTIIEDSDFAESEENNNYKHLIREFKYYGAVEKDFSTIINPHDAGINRFWRLINYFWSAYFSIVLPILEASKYAEDLTDNRYGFILENLEDITKYIYSDWFLEQIKVEKDSDYYKIFSEEFDVYCALTTNYTPFVQRLNLPCKNRYAFLSGELKLFEVPHEMRLIDIVEYKNQKTDFIFPFLYTQAPIKPIIEPRIIKEYAKTLEYLSQIDYLVVVGYSLGYNDNHINAFLRDFVMKQNKKFIYCNYNKKNFNPEETERHIKRSLRINDKSTPNIIVVENNGNPVELCKNIKIAMKRVDGTVNL